MTKTLKLPLAFSALLIAALLFISPAQAAAPRLAVEGDYSAHSDAEGVTSFNLKFYSKNTFKVKSWKQVKALAKKYRPKGVVLHVEGQKIKMTQIAEVMPEFIFPFYAPAEVPGLEYGPDYPAKVTFKNKAKKGTQTIKFTLTHYVAPPEEEDPGTEETDCDIDPDNC